MDWDAAKVVLDIFEFIVLGIIAIYVHMRTSNQVTEDKVQAMRKQMDEKFNEHSQRLSRMETAMEKGPTHEDLNRLHQRMDEQAEALHKLVGQFQSANSTLHMISQHLLNQGK